MKNDQAMPKWYPAYPLPIDGHPGHIVRYGLQTCPAQYLQQLRYTNQLRSQSDPNKPLHPHQYPKISPKWPHLKTPLHPSVIHQKAHSYTLR